jgi:S-adenosylmethionine hydrolase
MACRPIITLTSDFGTDDFYVAAMKAVLLQYCRDAQLVDITHEIARHDIAGGSFTLERALAVFPSGTVHLAVIDPGVGTDRRMLIAECNGSWIVCPDNGLITWTKQRQTMGRFFAIDWRPDRPSNTFHGRDVMAPIAGQLASGAQAAAFGHEIADPLMLGLYPAISWQNGRVIHLDHFGNATTNIPAELIDNRNLHWHVGHHAVGKLRQTYGDVAPGQPLALIGSSDLLEIAVREGSAAELLGIRIGDLVHAN